MNAGTDLARDIQTGFLNRLSLTPMRGVALLAGPARRASSRSASSRRSSTSRSASPSASDSQPGVAGVLVLLVFASLIALGFGALGAFVGAPHRLGRGGAGPLPALLRLPVHLVDEHPAQPDRGRLVPRRSPPCNPVSYLIECVRSLIITGWDGEALGARRSASPPRSRSSR